MRVLHSFSPLADHSDGQLPAPGTALLNVNGALYGTTSFGGRNKSSLDVCCGIIYSISLNGTEKVAYNFRGGFWRAVPLRRFTEREWHPLRDDGRGRRVRE